jgi:hypothetical protein
MINEHPYNQLAQDLKLLLVMGLLKIVFCSHPHSKNIFQENVDSNSISNTKRLESI